MSYHRNISIWFGYCLVFMHRIRYTIHCIYKDTIAKYTLGFQARSRNKGDCDSYR